MMIFNVFIIYMIWLVCPFFLQRCIVQMILLAGPGVLISTFFLGVALKVSFTLLFRLRCLCHVIKSVI